MSPQEVATITAMMAVIKEIGTWPLFSMLAALVLGPWVGMFVIARGQEKRHAAVVQMYQDNVKLVESTQKIAEGFQDIVVLSTQTLTRVQSSIDSNLFCPLMRKDPKVERKVE